MLLPNRHHNTPDYRYGFNNKEVDNEIKGEGAQYDYGFRIYDPRVGRFLSTDPLFKGYPWYTPYQFAGNKPIAFIDLDGLEEANVHVLGRYQDGTVKIRVLKTETPNNSNYFQLQLNYVGISNSNNLSSNLQQVFPMILQQGNSVLNQSTSPESAGSYDWAMKISNKALDETNTKLISTGNQVLLSDTSYENKMTNDKKEVYSGISTAGGQISTDVTLRTKLEFTINDSSLGGGGYIDDRGDQFIKEFAAPFASEFNAGLDENGISNEAVSNVSLGLSNWLYGDEKAVQKVKDYFQSLYPNALIDVDGNGTSIDISTRPIDVTEIYDNIPLLDETD